MNDQQLSEAIETLLVRHNPRNMREAQAALRPGYYLRAAQQLRDIDGVVLIGTGFPVTGTFETDGPVGAIALYNGLQSLGMNPLMVCGPPLSEALGDDYQVLSLTATNLATARREARDQLARLQPSALLSIERPGLAADNRYYNMRGEDISERCFFFDPFFELAQCPTLAIGDGGNEIGMGNIAEALHKLNIQPSVTRCDELMVADVSNWGAYGLLALLGHWAGRDLLEHFSPLHTLAYLSERGSVDGITGERTLTEDGMEAREGMHIIAQLRKLISTASSPP